jgi:hypothetical protein
MFESSIEGAESRLDGRMQQVADGRLDELAAF